MTKVTKSNAKPTMSVLEKSSTGNCASNENLSTQNLHFEKENFFLEDETHEILRNSQIKSNHLILAKRLDHVFINKKQKELNFLWILTFR